MRAQRSPPTTMALAPLVVEIADYASRALADEGAQLDDKDHRVTSIR